MKKNIYITGFAALTLAMGIASCSDYLDAENKSAGGKTAEEVFSKDAQSLLTSAYESMKDIVYVPEMNSQGTDLYVNTRGHVGGDFNTYYLTPLNSTVSSYYSNTYKTINYTNGIVNYAAAGSDLNAEARFLRAYCYYLLTQQFGAVPYIKTYINNASTSYPRTPLTEIYPDLIADLTDLYNNSSLKDQSHEGHASKQAVAALLAKVNLAAGWDLQTTLSNAENGTYTVDATTYFTEAAKWAETAISAAGLSSGLTMTFENKWSQENEGNAEEIFSIQYDRAGYPGDVATGGHSMQNTFGGYYGECTKQFEKQVNSDNHQSEKSIYLFEKGDQRYEATFMTTFYNSSGTWGTSGYYAFYNVDDKSKLPIAFRFFPYWVSVDEAKAEFTANQSQYVKGDNLNVVSAAIMTNPVTVFSFDANGKASNGTATPLNTFYGATNNGICVRKFDDKNSAQVGSKNDYRDIVVLHVSELYLTAAEAYLMAGQSAQALQKVNAVRSRAGVSTLSSFNDYIQNHVNYNTNATFTLNDLDVILDERARELYAEGYRWTDLRRTKQLIRYNLEFNEYVTSADQMMDATKSNYKWYRPIPSNEISANTGISQADQNPGYGATTEE